MLLHLTKYSILETEEYLIFESGLVRYNRLRDKQTFRQEFHFSILFIEELLKQIQENKQYIADVYTIQTKSIDQKFIPKKNDFYQIENIKDGYAIIGCYELYMEIALSFKYGKISPFSVKRLYDLKQK